MIVAYRRVSTNEQGDSGLGLDAQLESIRKVVGEPDKTFTDVASGSKPDRPGLLDALSALRKGDTLAVAKRDRLTRDSWQALSIERDCQKRKVSIVSAAGEGNGDDPYSEFLRRSLDNVATLERKMIGLRTKAALRQKKQRGEKTGGDVPFGFDVDGERLIANQGEQETLSTIQGLRDQGLTLRAICGELERLGVKTKRGNTTWQPRVVSRILTRAV